MAMEEAAYPKSLGMTAKFGACSMICAVRPAKVCWMICGCVIRCDVTAVVIATLNAIAALR